MKKLCLFLVILCTASLSAQEIITVACQPGLEKYYPLIRAVYAKMGMECLFSEMPSERALVEVNAGRADAEIGRLSKLEAHYPNIVYTTEPILYTGLVGYVLPDIAKTFNTNIDLPKHSIGILIGNKSSEAFVEKNHLQATAIPTIESLALMLHYGRLQLVILPSAVNPVLFEQFGIKVDIGAPKYPVFHIFSAKHKSLAPKWDKALREMKKDGTYNLYVK